MKVIIGNDGFTAHYYTRKALGNILSLMDNEVVMFDTKKSPYNVFDETHPDFFYGQAYNLTPGYIECIKEYDPYVVLRVSDWSPFRDSISEPVLKASKQEIEIVKQIHKVSKKVVLQTHHHPDYIELTHGNWIKEGYRLVSKMNFADIIDFTNGKAHEDLASDLCIISGYWPYKAQNIHKYIFPLLSPKENYSVHIFGNQAWPVPQYAGFLQPGMEKHVLKSAKICLSIHEPHSTKYGYDIVTRPFNLLANKCLVVSDYVEGLYKLFPNSILHCKTPKEYKDTIDTYLQKQSIAALLDEEEIAERVSIGYKEVIEKHTAFERIEVLYNALGIEYNPIYKQNTLEKLCL